jgi:UDP-N-acetylmuramoyl-tripeptide--D-alanyl-D-alanine ligase
MIISVSELSKLLHIGNLAAAGKATIQSVAIHSDAVEKGSLFVALVGEKQDGSVYLESALKRGAIAAITTNSHDGFALLRQKELAIEYGAALFVVDDSLKALHQLAKWHLAKFPNLKKIAITGSSGKTTVKNLLYTICSKAFKTHASLGNFNSETGLPLSVFQITAEHQLSILEMGMNHPGEIAALADIVEPDYAIITNIGSAHIGFLQSIEAIAAEKKAIFSRFDGKQVAFVPQHDAFAAYLAQGVDGQVIFYASETLKRLSATQELGLDGWLFRLNDETIHLQLPGRHNYENAILALYVAKELGIKGHHIKQGLEQVRASGHRSEVIKGNITLIKDCYNANPQSMQAAISMLKPLKYARKVAFLAEMKELGLRSGEYHRTLAPAILDADIHALFLLGREMLFLEQELKIQGFSGIIFCDSNIEKLKAHLKLYLKAGDLLLLKGSRAHQLEQLEVFLLEIGLLSAGKK